MTPLPRIDPRPGYPRMKPVMDADGNWITQPHMLWRDEKGWHDRPVTEASLDLTPTRKEAK